MFSDNYFLPISSKLLKAKKAFRNGLPGLLVLVAGLTGTMQAAAQTGCTVPSFRPAVNYTVGSFPFGIISADLNKDGKADLAVANRGAGGVSLLLGNGTGGFTAGTAIGLGTSHCSVISGDFNKDGNPDLATANIGPGTVSVFAGDGTGNFGPAIDYKVGSNTESVNTGDFNGDGFTDLVAANAGSANVSVLLNNSQGGFAPAVNYPAGNFPLSVVAADFNGDGLADLATANYYSDDVTLLLGDGLGSFGTPVNFPAGELPTSVISTDLNGDGKADLIVTNISTDQVSILLGNGLGSFAPATTYATGNGPECAAITDLNNDGKLDIATANFYSDSVSVLLGNGMGAFAAPVNFLAGDGGAFVAAADFNNDGSTDLATANGYADNASVLLNTCPAPNPVIIAPADTTVNCDAVPPQATLTATGNGPITVTAYQFPTTGIRALVSHYYPFEGNANDGKGTANGTPLNGVSFAPGIIDSAASFNGVNSYISFGTAAAISGTVSFAISAWVKTSSAAPQTIIEQRPAQGFDIDGEYVVNITSNHNGQVTRPGKVYFMVYNNSFQFEIFSNTRVDDGRWHHIVVEREGSNGRIFIDGVLNGSGSGPVKALDPAKETYVGQDVRDNNKAFDGLIDEIRIIAGTPACPRLYDLERTWIATAANGNKGAAQQVISVQDTTAPAIACPDNITVNNTPGQCGATVNFAATAPDNCSTSTITYDKAPGSFFPVGTTPVVVTATDACGNRSTCTFTITVVDNEKPVVTCAATQRFCRTAAGTYTIPVTTATDNCGVGTFSYTITGATTRNGNGTNASGVFATGTSTIAWAVTDVNGNVGSCITTVIINSLPVASITVAPNNFCNAVTVTAQSTLGGPFSYQWFYNNALFATTQSISLTNANGDGAYSVFVTDGNGCRSAAPAIYTYSKQSQLSNYTLLAKNEIDLGEKNRVLSGSVGILNTGGSAEFEEYSSVASPGAFVKAPEIEVENPVNIPTRIYAVAAVTLPPMQYNTTSTNNLPSYTVNQNTTVTLTGNYKNLNIKKGATVTLTGTIFGSISIDEGATVTFTATTINLADLKVGNSDNRVATVVRFANNTSVRVSRYITVDENCSINPENNKLTFYIGSPNYTDGKLEVKKGNSKIVANVLVPYGKIDVKGDDDYATYMTGLFVADEIESGENVTWNSFDCNSTAPAITSRTATENSMQALVVPAEKLPAKFDVVVMPNPTTSHFTFKVSSDKETSVSIRMLNNLGQVVETAAKVNANSNVMLGAKLHSGTYMAEVTQGNERKMIRLMKLN